MFNHQSQHLFGQLQFNHERTVVPPDALRKVLAQPFSDQQRFQLGFTDDAAECFENILLRIHFHLAINVSEDMCNVVHCIPHQKFAIALVEQSVCGACSAASEPLSFTQMVHYVSASAVICQAKQMVGATQPDLFGQLLKKAGGMGDTRDCPSSCGAKIQIRRTLINRPEIVSVGIVWDSDRPSFEHITSLLDTLSVHLRLSDVFHGSFDVHNSDDNYHQLVGVVTYYGKHYSTFFYHTKLKMWVYFDDANVREVGPHWEHVVEKCRKGRFQPLLLLFANPNGTPVDSSKAPKTVSLVDMSIINSMRNGHYTNGNLVVRGPSPSSKCALVPGRRLLTPNLEKSSDELNQRRVITPNLEQSPNEKLMLPNNDYQNLVQFQQVIFNRPNITKEKTLKRQDSLEDKNFVRKELVRRDSGIWSGDRNSASSSSSTSMENPYHYISEKIHLKNYGSASRSPNKNGDLSSNSGNSSGGQADPGYDSFSMSSTDSHPLQQNLKHNLQLDQIPEGHQTPPGTRYVCDENAHVADECKRLCAEVDQLLVRSEHAEDLLTALSLCNAAVTKARAAMDAPYSNQQTASFATMKHNACVLRARSLHRKIEEPLHNSVRYGETRHSREGSGSSARESLRSHSRQNSKDKGNHTHSRQNNQELLDPSSSNPLNCDFKSLNGEELSTSKNIEIYATLPKNIKSFLSLSSPKIKNVCDDEEYLMKEKPGHDTVINHSKLLAKKCIEKRARSEDRNSKNSKDVPPVTNKHKEQEQKDTKKLVKLEEKQNKKQHKIRRKLFMGGWIRRKNRSMPDLRDEESSVEKPSAESNACEVSKDDSMVNSRTAIQSNLNGYLSEGNLECSGNPNLERSKLMRKSFHSSKVHQLNKVRPPPPLRTTSQLSKNAEYPKTGATVYTNHNSCSKNPASLPYLLENFDNIVPKTDAITYSSGGFPLNQAAMNTVVTEAQIHHDASFQSLSPLMSEAELINQMEDVNFQLPPYPSPVHSNLHSRQASEDFPPPPPILSAQEVPSSLLSMLQEKKENMLSGNIKEGPKKIVGGDSLLQELQARQAERRKNVDRKTSVDCQNRNLKSKFEQLGVDEVDCVPQTNIKSSLFISDETTNEYKNPAQEKRKNSKKKNVSFCEQVVLVATAEDDEDNSYIPNPILERVLRTVRHKEASMEMKEHAVHSVVPLKRTYSWRLTPNLQTEPVTKDVSDAPSVPAKSPSVRQMMQQTVAPTEFSDDVDEPMVQNQDTSYPSSTAHTPHYTSATALCPQNRPEYREPKSSIRCRESYDQYSCNNVDQTTRNYQDNVRFSLICNRDMSPLKHGYPAYVPYQSSSSPSYQPMSLQYNPSQSRSSPQIMYRDENVKSTPASVMRQCSNVSNYNRHLVAQDLRLMPVTSMSQKPILTSVQTNQQIQYVSSGPQSQIPLNGTQLNNEYHINSMCGSKRQSMPISTNCGSNGKAITGQQNSGIQSAGSSNAPFNDVVNFSSRALTDLPHHSQPMQYASNSAGYPYGNKSAQSQYISNTTPTQNSTGNYESHYPTSKSDAARPISTISPYRSVPFNSPPAYEPHSRGPTYNSSPYQHVPNANYQKVTKFLPPQPNSLPPVFLHPASLSNNNKTGVYQRVPTPNEQMRQDHKYTTYQHAPIPKQMDIEKKENANVPCNLCRKKQVTPSSVYCNDCEFYISRFQQKT